MVQFLCYVTFWKSFHSGSETFYSDTDPAAAGAAAASAAASVFTTAFAVVASEAAAEAAAAAAPAATASQKCLGFRTFCKKFLFDDTSESSYSKLCPSKLA